MPRPWFSLIERADVVSFDVFDTALLRKVARPIDVFRMVERHFRFLHPGVTPFPFAERRPQAEALARARHADREDITLEQIYESFELPADWPAERLCSLELESERHLNTANPFISKLYRHAIASGKKVVFISDMYLPPTVIRGLLEGAGYRADSLFVSSAHSVTKGSGRLFELALNSLSVPRYRVLHIGDNPIADVWVPLKSGIAALLYERCSLRASPTDGEPADEAASVRRGLLQNLYAERGRSSAPSASYRLGYEHFGPRLARGLTVEGEAEVSRGAHDFVAEFSQVRAHYPWLD